MSKKVDDRQWDVFGHAENKSPAQLIKVPFRPSERMIALNLVIPRQDYGSQQEVCPLQHVMVSRMCKNADTRAWRPNQWGGRLVGRRSVTRPIRHETEASPDKQ